MKAFLFSLLSLAHADELGRVGFAVDMFYQDCARYPVALSELLERPGDCPNWGPDPYVSELPRDRWGNELRYRRLKGDRFELLSLGRDGREGGTGDDADVLWKSAEH